MPGRWWSPPLRMESRAGRVQGGDRASTLSGGFNTHGATGQSSVLETFCRRQPGLETCSSDCRRAGPESNRMRQHSLRFGRMRHVMVAISRREPLLRSRKLLRSGLCDGRLRFRLRERPGMSVVPAQQIDGSAPPLQRLVRRVGVEAYGSWLRGQGAQGR